MAFVQIFADRPRNGTSHPKQSAMLPPLVQIAAPPKSAILIDDLATSGGHLEQAVLALRQLGVAASAVAWISGSRTGGACGPKVLSE
ncbi:MAG TPA: phosphoribosyltransferase [Stellaceae bacterium]|nr:phosphoribosyltransferase [Stellaceae bacterium]